MLVVMSDGVFEARSQHGVLMDIERVMEVLDGCRGVTPGEMLSRLRHAIRQWQGKEEPVDDQTVAIVQYVPKSGGLR